MNPVEIRPWRRSPFIVGQRYRVRQDFEAMRDRFRKDEVLTYERDAYSRHDGSTAYCFSQPDSKVWRTWDVPDDDDLETWRERFEEVPHGEGGGSRPNVPEEK